MHNLSALFDPSTCAALIGSVLIIAVMLIVTRPKK